MKGIFASVVFAAVLTLAGGPLAAQQVTGHTPRDGAPVRVAGLSALTLAATPAELPRAVQPLARAGFEETGFAQFMASPTGRWLRIGAGLGMIAGGVAMGDTGGAVLAGVGVVPLSAGVLDLCYISALFGGPIGGREIRAAGR